MTCASAVRRDLAVRVCADTGTSELGEAVVRDEISAGRVAAVTRAEEQDGFGYFLRPADPSKARHLLEHLSAGIESSSVSNWPSTIGASIEPATRDFDAIRRQVKNQR